MLVILLIAFQTCVNDKTAIWLYSGQNRVRSNRYILGKMAINAHLVRKQIRKRRLFKKVQAFCV